MQFGLAMFPRGACRAFGKPSTFWDDAAMNNQIEAGLPVAGNSQSNKIISCGTCKHSISPREHSDKIACLRTLEFHDRDDDAAFCEHAEHNSSL